MEYRFNFKLRRRGQPALDQNRIELKSENYDSDEEYCLALAAEALELIQQDREYLEESEGNDESNYTEPTKD
jgi:hypothetical protein